MSQFWHANWAEDGYKPTRLQNWEVPRWHPEWPDRHCTTTKFIGHSNGRLYPNNKQSKITWSDFQGTWELPLKINRQTAEKLSKNTENNKIAWNNHLKLHQILCNRKCRVQKKESNKTVQDEINSEDKPDTILKQKN